MLLRTSEVYTRVSKQLVETLHRIYQFSLGQSWESELHVNVANGYTVCRQVAESPFCTGLLRYCSRKNWSMKMARRVEPFVMEMSTQPE